MATNASQEIQLVNKKKNKRAARAEFTCTCARAVVLEAKGGI